MNTGNRHGNTTIEFTLAGLAAVILLISTVQLAVGMWNYHTLAYAVHQSARYISFKGIGCTQSGNSCSATVGNIANQFAAEGIGIPSGQVNVTLTTASGAATSCAPLNSCFSNATVWPPSTNSDNNVGKLITVSAKYKFQAALMLFWPGQAHQNYGAVWLPATSSQEILF